MSDKKNSSRDQQEFDIHAMATNPELISMHNLHHVLMMISSGKFVPNDYVDDSESWEMYRVLCRIRFELDREFRDNCIPRLSGPVFLADFPCEAPPQRLMA
jgi:hypothetical protein